MRRYVLTGTPGAGKTTIPRALADRGFDVVGEAATEVITRGQARGDAEPWTRETFVDEVAALQHRRQTRAPAPGVTVQVYDRSPVRTHALSVYLGRPVPAAPAAELERITRERVYRPQVFFVRAIGFCEPTAARRIGFRESLEFERVHEESYRRFGYRLLDVPAGPVADRATLVADTIARLTG